MIIKESELRNLIKEMVIEEAFGFESGYYFDDITNIVRRIIDPIDHLAIDMEFPRKYRKFYKDLEKFYANRYTGPRNKIPTSVIAFLLKELSSSIFELESIALSGDHNYSHWNEEDIKIAANKMREILEK